MTTRNRTRILRGVLICCAMLLGMLPTLALAEPVPAFSGGAGTQAEPYLIGSAADLVELQTFVNTGKSAEYGPTYGNFDGYYFKQTADIDLTGYDWDPIGYSGGYYFAGNYDGDNHFIQNAVSDGKVDDEGYSTVGIFGWAAFGSISNLHVDNADFTATGTRNYSYAGGIAGVTFGASITNCSVSNSKIESRRTYNNNCAGSISGFATGGTFTNCAAEHNAIKATTYGGGFVGEIDDDYGVGNSTFANCYVAGSSVTTSTQEVQGMNDSGGFAGELTASALTITNCFVYDTAILIGEDTKAVPGLQFTGLFAGNQWQTAAMSPINAINCYYGEVDVTQRAGAASERSKMAFADGTVLGLLGSAFSKGVEHPILRSEPVKLRSISVVTAPSKTAYIVGDDFDPSHMAVIASYSNVTDKDITDYVITNGTDLTAGQTSVTIRYTERGITRETTQAISVYAATPAASPVAGTYTSAQNVTLSCATPGATIRYTTNGDEPTEASAEYTAAIHVTATTTIKAKAFLTNGTTSETMIATYTIAGTQLPIIGTPLPIAGTPLPIAGTPLPIAGTALPITAHPTDQYVSVGQQATFSVSATGEGLTYQWYIDRGDGLGWRELDGKTGASHTTTQVKLENDGYRYFCRVTDAHGHTVDSDVATLHVSKVAIPPKTGDSSTPMLWLGLCLLGCAGLLTLTLSRRRRA